MSGIDGRVTGLNRDAFTSAKLAQLTTNNREKGTVEASMIKKAVLKDGVVDDAERDLLNELTSDKKTVTISAQSSASFQPSDLSFSNNWSDRGVEILNSIQSSQQPAQTGNADLNRAWSQNPPDFAQLTSIYSRSSSDASRVVDFLADKAHKAWDESSLGNGYGPLRGLISQAYTGVNQLEGKANADGRNMLHRAISQIDKNPDGSNGAIPDFLYNWIRPGGYL